MVNDHIVRVTLRHFQCWKEVTIYLDRGLNAISGPTMNGKSAIIRGLEWVFLNNIQGDGFRPTTYELKNSEMTVAEVEFADGVVISRQKNQAGFNGYVITIPDQEPLVLDKVSNKVPAEVLALIRIDEKNIQGQEDNRFLISKATSPGMVARKLNELVGLQKIDTVRDKSRKVVDKISSELKLTQLGVKKDKEELETLWYLDVLEEEITKLDSLTTQSTSLQKQISSSIPIISRIKSTQERIDKRTQWIQVEDKVKTLDEMVKRSKSLQTQLSALLPCIEKIKTLKEDIQQTSKWLQVETHFDTVQANVSMSAKLSSTINSTVQCLTSIKALNKRVEDNTSWLGVEKELSVIEVLQGRSRSLNLQIERLSTLIASIKAGIRAKEKKEWQLYDLVNKRDQLVQSIKMCPVFEDKECCHVEKVG